MVLLLLKNYFSIVFNPIKNITWAKTMWNAIIKWRQWMRTESSVFQSKFNSIYSVLQQ